MLEPSAIDAWLARDGVELDRRRLINRFLEQVDNLSDSVIDALIGFAERMGGDEARDFLEALADRDPTKRKALQTLIRSHAAERSAERSGRAFGLAASVDFELDDRTLAAVRAAAAEVDVGELERLAAAPDERMRIVAVELLAARGADALPALVARLDDPADDVALDGSFHGSVRRSGRRVRRPRAERARR